MRIIETSDKWWSSSAGMMSLKHLLHAEDHVPNPNETQDTPATSAKLVILSDERKGVATFPLLIKSGFLLF